MGDAKPARVLVVDDEETIRESLMAYLDDCDFAVSAVASAEEALELIGERPQDVGIIDLRLPGMSGDTLILRAHEIAPDMRFLLHTGSSNYSLTGDLERIGLRPEHVFRKPIPDLDILVKGIRDLLH
jgi:two-component system, OmpR family, response regulator